MGGEVSESESIESQSEPGLSRVQRSKDATVSDVTSDMTKSDTQSYNDIAVQRSIEGVYEETEQIISRAICSDESTLVATPPGGGKTTSAFKQIKESDKQFTYLTAREDLYEEGVRLCEEFGIEDYVVYPAPHRDCEAFQKGSCHHSPEAEALYGLGVSARRIHSELDLGCSPGCEYIEKIEQFDPDSTKLVIGHYQHGYIDSLTEDRVVIIDEMPISGFEEDYDANDVITPFLKATDGIPFKNFSDLVANNDNKKEMMAHEWFGENGVIADETEILEADENCRYDKLAPLLTHTVLESIPIGGDYDGDQEIVNFEIPWFNWVDDDFEKDRYAVFDTDNQKIHVLTAPDLGGAENVIGLDGTPTQIMWERATGENFEVESPISHIGIDSYIHDILGMTIKQTNDSLKAYSSGNISSQKDESILYGAEVEEGQKPALITPKKALKEYRKEGIADRASDSMNYANILSSNDFGEEEVGVLLGCPFPGHDVIRKWAAYFAESSIPEGEGMEKTFGDFGDQFYHHFVHNKVLQAILRFGRKEGVEATVYVNTAAIPDEITIDSRVEPEIFNSENKREIADHLREAGDDGATKSDLEGAADVHEDTVDNILDGFRDHDLITEDQESDWPYRKVVRWDP